MRDVSKQMGIQRTGARIVSGVPKQSHEETGGSVWERFVMCQNTMLEELRLSLGALAERVGNRG